jgi:hypothetical protein
MFDPHDFYEFAKELKSITSQYQEANKRTIISRMYYASFLIIRDLLKDKLQKTTVKAQFDTLYTDPYIHGLVMDAILIADGHARSLLYTLRKKRNDAEYKMRSKNWDEEIEKVSQITKELIVNKFPGLPSKFDQQLPTIQDKVEMWFSRKCKRYQ